MINNLLHGNITLECKLIDLEKHTVYSCETVVGVFTTFSDMYYIDTNVFI